MVLLTTLLQTTRLVNLKVTISASKCLTQEVSCIIACDEVFIKVHWN